MLYYISLGTLFNEHPEFYRHCFAAFANSMYQVVLSVGHKTPLSSLGDIPPKFIVQNYVPQLEILQRANVFISHGGMNSVSEALYYGVPLLVIPQSADQPWVAKRVAQLGAGKLLPRTRATPGLHPARSNVSPVRSLPIPLMPRPACTSVKPCDRPGDTSAPPTKSSALSSTPLITPRQQPPQGARCSCKNSPPYE